MNAELEAEILFPMFAEKGGEETQEMVQEGMEEHHMLEFMMDGLKKTRPEDKTFNAKFKALMESTKHHFMEEKREICPTAKGFERRTGSPGRGDGCSRKTGEKVGTASNITVGTDKRHLSRYRLLSAWKVL